jgi:hypothetical protein
MSDSELKKEIDKGWQQLDRLRDEIRVRLHLGSMDLRDAFATIDKEAHTLGHTITQATRMAVHDLNKRLQKIADALTH